MKSSMHFFVLIFCIVIKSVYQFEFEMWSYRIINYLVKTASCVVLIFKKKSSRTVLSWELNVTFSFWFPFKDPGESQKMRCFVRRTGLIHVLAQLLVEKLCYWNGMRLCESWLKGSMRYIQNSKSFVCYTYCNCRDIFQNLKKNWSIVKTV